MGISEAEKGQTGTCLRERLCPATAELAQLPVQLPQGLPPLCLGFCVDQVRQPLHLGQAQLPVGEGPPGELARLRRPQPWHPACGMVAGAETLAPHPGPLAGSDLGPQAEDSPRACRTPLTTAGPPCTWNSTQSSPVKLWGPSVGRRGGHIYIYSPGPGSYLRLGVRGPSPGNQSTKARSSGSPERGSVSRRRLALRARGSSRGAVKLRRACPLAGPLVRITAMPQRPWPELSAKMVAPDPGAPAPLLWRTHGLGKRRGESVHRGGRLCRRAGGWVEGLTAEKCPKWKQALRLEGWRWGGPEARW